MPSASTRHIFEFDLEGYVEDFNERVIGAYNSGRRRCSARRHGRGPLAHPGRHRRFPRFLLHRAGNPGVRLNDNCVGCMTCVTECPDTAILGKVVEPTRAGPGPGRGARRQTGLAGRAVGRPPTNSSTCRRRRKPAAAASSASSSTPPSARAAPNACRSAPTWATTP